mgnify:CR=1 FL=1
MNRNRLIPLFLATALVLAACSGDDKAQDAGSAQKSDQQAIATSSNRLSKSQPIRSYDYSQLRDVVLDVQEIQATGTLSTTAGYLEGVGLIWWCPSIGPPVPSTYQLSGAKQGADLPGDRPKEWKEVDQPEATGVYIGESTGTWTICVDDNGKKFGKYWEGYTDSTASVVSTFPDDKRVVVDQVTFEFSTEG